MLAVPTGRSRVPGSLSRAVGAILAGRASERGLTQGQLGTAAGVSQSQVSKLFRGERALTLDQYDALCEALDLDIVGILIEAEEGRS